MRFLTIALFLLATGAASAEEKPAAVMGHGMATCAEFAKVYRESPTEKTEITFFVWAQGYMSGLNLVQYNLKKPRHDLNAWSISDQESHIRHFCEEKPLSEYLFAVLSLFNALPEIPPNSN